MDDTRTIIDTYRNALRAGDLPALKATFAPDVTWWLPGALPVSGTWRGPDAIVDDFLGTVMARLRPGSVQFTTTSTLIAGDVAVLEWRVSATRVDGEPYDNDYIAVFETRDGRIAAVREYLDTTAMARLFAATAA